MRGQLISIEGTEGAGKSTALAWMKEYFKAKHIPVCMTREPGGTALAEAIRDVLLQTPTNEPLTREAECLLMFAARAQHVQQVIRPALQAGSWVVSDRFIDASYAYQGGGRELEMGVLQFLDEWVVGDCQPDLTLLFDLPVEIGLARAKARTGEQDRIEREHVDFFNRVRQVYLDRAARFPERIKVIDAAVNPEAVMAQVERAIAEFVERHPS